MRILVLRIMFMRIQKKRRKNKDLRDELNHPKHLLEDQRRSKLSQGENLCKGLQLKGRKNLKSRLLKNQFLRRRKKRSKMVRRVFLDLQSQSQRKKRRLSEKTIRKK